MSSLASTLRTIREHANLTQEELAERSGLSARTISDIERGLRRRLYADTAGRLAAALQLSNAAAEEFTALARGRTDRSDHLDLAYRHRFVAAHLQRVETLAAQVGHEGQWFAALDADAANIEVAMRWADEAGDAESELRLATGLWQYWQARGALSHGRDWLERGLAGSTVSPGTRMKALWALAWLAFEQGDDDAAGSCADRLDAIAAQSADDTALRNAATVRGMVALAADDPGAAHRELALARELAARLEQPWLVATSCLNLGLAEIATGSTEAARASLSEALRRYEEIGDERFRARCLGYLGLAALVEGAPERAQSLYAQSLAGFAALAEPKGTAEGLAGLAAVAAATADPVRAATLGGSAERLRESFAGRPLPLDARIIGSHLEEARGASAPEASASAWTSGRALRLDEAVAFALGAG